MSLRRLARRIYEITTPRTYDPAPPTTAEITAGVSGPMEMDEFLAHLVRLDATSNPTKGLWDKRNTSSGHFEAIKRSGDVFKGVKREN